MNINSDESFSEEDFIEEEMGFMKDHVVAAQDVSSFEDYIINLGAPITSIAFSYQDYSDFES